MKTTMVDYVIKCLENEKDNVKTVKVSHRFVLRNCLEDSRIIKDIVSNAIEDYEDGRLQ